MNKFAVEASWRESEEKNELTGIYWSAREVIH